MTVAWAQLLGWGFSVFPLRPRSKRPVGEWKDFQSRRATESEIAEWSAHADYNGAIATGTISGVIVLDTDSDEADASIRARGLPVTPTCRTGKGRHYYFRHPGGSVRNFAGKLPGCDLRADGGYVAAPGSVHPSGALYRWEVTPDEAAFADPPAWLLELIHGRETGSRAEPVSPPPRPATRYADAAFDRELTRVRRSPVGQRNDTLNGAAFNLGQLVATDLLSRDQVAAHLLGTALAIGLTEAEARATIESGLRAGQAQPRALQAAKNGSSSAQYFAPSNVRSLSEARRARETPSSTEGVILPRLDPLSWCDAPVPPRRWLVRDWIPLGEVTSLYGDGGLGKSLIAQQLVTAAATGTPWLGLEIMPCRALAMLCEDSPAELHRRQAAINAAMGLTMGDLENASFIPLEVSDGALMRFDFDGSGKPTATFAALVERARELGAQLIVIDTVADAFGGDENDRNQVSQFGNLLKRLATELEAAIVLCAHPSLEGMRNKHGYSGSTAWNARVRSRLTLTIPESEEERSRTGQPSTTEERLLTRRKSNYASAGEEIRLIWRDGVFMPVAPFYGEVARIERRSAEHIFLECLDVLTASGRHVSDSPKSDRYAPSVLSTMSLARDCSPRELVQAMGRLFDQGKIVLVPVGSPSGPKKIVKVSK